MFDTSSQFLLSGVTSVVKGAPATCVRISISLHIPHQPLNRHHQVPYCMHYVMVVRLALIGRSPPTALVARPIQAFHIEEVRQNGDARGGVQTLNRTCSAPDYYVTSPMMSFNRCQKGVTTNIYGGTDNMAAFVQHWLFNDY